jgi:hypothetical protein
MRACFQKAGLPSPRFVTINSETNLETLALPGPFPLVIKPVDNMGGRGCRRLDRVEELQEAAPEAIGFSRSGRAILEAFMEGPEFSVDAIVYHGEITICGLADRHIFFPPYFIETGHTMPTIIEPEKQKALLETFCEGARALGLAGEGSIGAAKGDIKLTPGGPMIGEIAARLSGGYMSGWTYPYSSGALPIKAAILMAMGRKPEGHKPLKNWTSAERAFISIPGTVKSIHGIEAARETPHIRDLFLRVTCGGKVSFPENNVSKCGNVISAAPERKTAVEAAETAARSILIRLEPQNGETAAFLEAETLFPPPAFQLSGELRAKLNALPNENELNHRGRKETTEDTEEKKQYPISAVSVNPLCSSVVNNLVNPRFELIPFPELLDSGLTDYAGRGVAETLQAVRTLTSRALPETANPAGKNAADLCNKRETTDNQLTPQKGAVILLGRSFWKALVRGGYQGAVYYIDSLFKEKAF